MGYNINNVLQSYQVAIQPGQVQHINQFTLIECTMFCVNDVVIVMHYMAQ